MEQYIPKSAVVAWALEELKLAEKFYKETKSDVYFGKINLLKKELSFLNTLEVKEVPIWEKVSPDTGQTTLYKDEDKSYLERFGYRIDLKELDKLPKKNLKAQKENRI